MKERIIMTTCRFDCEMVVGPDVTIEAEEIRKIYDESIAISVLGKFSFVSISDFKNAAGQTIGDFLLDKHEDFAITLAETESVK